jgi:uncharacterized protein YjbI with pentapeptide repeats
MSTATNQGGNQPGSKSNCDIGHGYQTACASSLHKTHQGRRFCVLHYPVGDGVPEKTEEFEQELERKFRANDYNFCGVEFPDIQKPHGWKIFPGNANFTGAVFHGHADFSHVEFQGAAIFIKAVFKRGASFFRVQFKGGGGCPAAVNSSGAEAEKCASFEFATFEGSANFTCACFLRAVDFSAAVFEGVAIFRSTEFCTGVVFRDATFRDYLRIEGDKQNRVFGRRSWVDFQYARMEKPEHVIFQEITLRPNWFVNVDAREFEFVNVEWPDLLRLRWMQEDERTLRNMRLDQPRVLLATACQRLAVNAEENQRYADASAFRYAALDLQRRQRRFGGFLWRLEWWYWFASGYGERLFRSILILLCLWVVSAAIYAQVGFARWESHPKNREEARTEQTDTTGEPLSWRRALVYSGAVMTLQKPEPRPATTTGQSAVLLESILGPLQGALLALAIRRRFMRT